MQCFQILSHPIHLQHHDAISVFCVLLEPRIEDRGLRTEERRLRTGGWELTASHLLRVTWHPLRPKRCSKMFSTGEQPGHSFASFRLFAFIKSEQFSKSAFSTIEYETLREVVAMKFPLRHKTKISLGSRKSSRRWNRLLFPWSVFPELDE